MSSSSISPLPKKEIQRLGNRWARLFRAGKREPGAGRKDSLGLPARAPMRLKLLDTAGFVT